MQREERLVIRVNRNELVAIKRLAEATRLPPSTAARKILLDLAAAVEKGEQVATIGPRN